MVLALVLGWLYPVMSRDDRLLLELVGGGAKGFSGIDLGGALGGDGGGLGDECTTWGWSRAIPNGSSTTTAAADGGGG